jgi:tripartite-type tricarboxylate transporter receptor subunit TctC
MLGRIALAAGFALLALPSVAQNFYEGKTVTIVTSTGAGGTYDLTARLVARFMPKYLPGNPTMVVQNMPGGGNVLATNYMYTIAPKDGTSIATIHDAMPLHQVLDGRGVRFDASKFNWLGSTGPENEVIITWHTAGIRTIDDVRKKEVVLGGTGAGSGIFIIPMAMNRILGTKFKMVIGYKSSEDVNLAMQRGEIQARAFSMTSITAQHPDWLKNKTVDFIAQAGEERDHTIPNVPLLTELATNDVDKQVMKLISSPPGLGRPYVAPPDVPADRVALLRKALAATFADKAFVAECEKLQMDIDPMSAEEVTKIVSEVIGAPPEVVARAKVSVADPKDAGGQ